MRTLGTVGEERAWSGRLRQLKGGESLTAWAGHGFGTAICTNAGFPHYSQAHSAGPVLPADPTAAGCALREARHCQIMAEESSDRELRKAPLLENCKKWGNHDYAALPLPILNTFEVSR